MMKHKDIVGEELKTGDYVLYCEAGRGSSSSIQFGIIGKMSPATVFVKNGKYDYRSRQSRSPEWDLYKITKEHFEILMKR